MAKLNVEEIKSTTVTLEGLDRPVSEDREVQKEIGLAAHYVLARLQFRDDHPGEVFVRDLLSDLKLAMGVRAPRVPVAEDGPQPVSGDGATKAPARAPKEKATPAEAGGAAATTPSGKRRGRPPGSKNKPKEDAAAPQGEASAPPEEPEGSAGAAEPEPADAGATGAKLADPFEGA